MDCSCTQSNAFKFAELPERSFRTSSDLETWRKVFFPVSLQPNSRGSRSVQHILPLHTVVRNTFLNLADSSFFIWYHRPVSGVHCKVSKEISHDLTIVFPSGRVQVYSIPSSIHPPRSQICRQRGVLPSSGNSPTM